MLKNTLKGNFDITLKNNLSIFNQINYIYK